VKERNVDKRKAAPEPTITERRDFLKNGVAALAGLWLLGDAALGAAMDLELERLPQEPGGTAAGGNVAVKPADIAKTDPGDPELVKPFLDEKLKFNLSFLTITTATGLITFKRTGRNEYTGSVEGTVAGIVGAVTPYRKVVMTSVMRAIKTTAGHRFVATTFYRTTITTDGTSVSRHDFDYGRRRWTYTRTKNGRQEKVRHRRIPKGVYYDDFVCIMYNFRGHAYGKVQHGMNLTVKTLPMARTITAGGKATRRTTDVVQVIVPKLDQLSPADRDWLKAIDADLMVLVRFDPEIYGIKSGEGKFAGKLATMDPRGSWAKDVLLFGDVLSKRSN